MTFAHTFIFWCFEGAETRINIEICGVKILKSRKWHVP